MKTFAMVAVGLALLTARTSAAEVQEPTQTMKLTTGKVVTTLQLSTAYLQRTKESWFKVTGKKVRTEPKSMAVTGEAVFNSPFGLKMMADEIKINLDEEETPKSFSLSGKVVIQVQEDGKEVMRITADNALLEPQWPLNVTR